MGIFTFIGIIFTELAGFITEALKGGTTAARSFNKTMGIVELQVDVLSVEVEQELADKLLALEANSSTKAKKK